MTVPTERANAIIMASDFIRDLIDRIKTKRIPSEIRKEYWLRFDSYGHPLMCAPEPIHKKHNDDSVVHVTELREGEVIVSREDLARAFDKDWAINRHKTYQEKLNLIFKELEL